MFINKKILGWKSFFVFVQNLKGDTAPPVKNYRTRDPSNQSTQIPIRKVCNQIWLLRSNACFGFQELHGTFFPGKRFCDFRTLFIASSLCFHNSIFIPVPAVVACSVVIRVRGQFLCFMINEISSRVIKIRTKHYFLEKCLLSLFMNRLFFYLLFYFLDLIIFSILFQYLRHTNI